MTFVPDLFQLTDGRFEATCGKCLKLSPSITARDKATAWGELLKLGVEHLSARSRYAGVRRPVLRAPRTPSASRMR